MSVLIVGYPYIRENYFNTLRSYPEKDKLFFLLPSSWGIKSGKVIYYPPKDRNVHTTKAYFHHSQYPIIGGLLKGFMPGYFLFLLKERKRKNIKVVVTLTEPILLTTLYQAFIAKILGLKHFLFTWENIAYKDKFYGLNGLVKDIIIKLNLSFSDGIICGNKKAVEIFKNYTKKPTPNIPFAGVDTNFFKPRKDEKVFRNTNLDGKLVYSFVGALEARKGVDMIIEAFSQVLKEIPESHLIIAGTGHQDYEIMLDRLIHDKSIDKHISKVPWIDHEELKHVFAISDVFVYPSLPYKGWEEQLGYLLIEAASAGLPIISTDSGSISEVIINNQSGILMKAPFNMSQLAQDMIKLGRESELRNKFGEKAREHIVNNFSVRVIADKFYNFLSQYDK